MFQLPDQIPSRWRLITKALTEHLSSVSGIERAIRCYQSNPVYLQPFGRLRAVFGETRNTDCSASSVERRRFWDVVLPLIIRLVVEGTVKEFGPPHSLQRRRKCREMLLVRQSESSVSLSHCQCAVLLAHVFLCTLQQRAFKDHQPHMPPASAVVLFTSTVRKRAVEAKLRMLVNYFFLSSSAGPTTVRFHRKCVPLSDRVFDLFGGSTSSALPMCPLALRGDRQRLEDVGPAPGTQVPPTRVIFANKYVGGGVLRRGAVQEEILMCCSPESICACILAECLDDNEALLVSGARSFSSYSGYGESLRFDPDQSPPQQLPAVACHIDALNVSQQPGVPGSSAPPRSQYTRGAVNRELLKAFAGFSARLPSHSAVSGGSAPPIVTGNWGSGAFGGNPQLKLVIQWVAASAAAASCVIYCPFGNPAIRSDMINELKERVKACEASVSSMYATLMQSVSTFDKLMMRSGNTGDPVPQFFEVLTRQLNAGIESDTDESIDSFDDTDDTFVYQPYASGPRVTCAFVDSVDSRANVHWHLFYAQNRDHFFKDRHWLRKSWPELTTPGALNCGNPTDNNARTPADQWPLVLDVGSGCGNTMWPLLEHNNPNLRICALDFAASAIHLLHKSPLWERFGDRVSAHVYDAANPSDKRFPMVSDNSCDAALLVFTLSAVRPTRMAAVIEKIWHALRPGGILFVRDYADGDMAQRRFEQAGPDKQLGVNWFVRGDLTQSFFFKRTDWEALFDESKWQIDRLDVVLRETVNRATKTTFNRRFWDEIFPSLVNLLDKKESYDSMTRVSAKNPAMRFGAATGDTKAAQALEKPNVPMLGSQEGLETGVQLAQGIGELVDLVEKGMYKSSGSSVVAPTHQYATLLLTELSFLLKLGRRQNPTGTSLAPLLRLARGLVSLRIKLWGVYYAMRSQCGDSNQASGADAPKGEGGGGGGGGVGGAGGANGASQGPGGGSITGSGGGGRRFGSFFGKFVPGSSGGTIKSPAVGSEPPMSFQQLARGVDRILKQYDQSCESAAGVVEPTHIEQPRFECLCLRTLFLGHAAVASLEFANTMLYISESARLLRNWDDQLSSSFGVPPSSQRQGTGSGLLHRDTSSRDVSGLASALAGPATDSAYPSADQMASPTSTGKGTTGSSPPSTAATGIGATMSSSSPAHAATSGMITYQVVRGWLGKFHSALLSKAGLYFSSTLDAIGGSLGCARPAPDLDFCALAQNWQLRADCECVAVIADIRPSSRLRWTPPGVHQCLPTAQSLAGGTFPGLRSFPPLFLCPMANEGAIMAEHWPNVVSLLMTEAAALSSASEAFYQFDPKLNITYFAAAVESGPSVFVIIIFRDRRKQSDKLVNEFLPLIIDGLRLTSLFKSWRS